jgi:hypothetical protein
LKSEQSKYRKTLSELAVEEMGNLFREVVKERCNGCRIDHPSQRQHQCLESVEENVDAVFFILMIRMDWEIE